MSFIVPPSTNIMSVKPQTLNSGWNNTEVVILKEAIPPEPTVGIKAELQFETIEKARKAESSHNKNLSITGGFFVLLKLSPPILRL